jgi:hypothetical protein
VNRFIEAMKLINDIKKFFDDAATSADKFGKVHGGALTCSACGFRATPSLRLVRLAGIRRQAQVRLHSRGVRRYQWGLEGTRGGPAEDRGTNQGFLRQLHQEHFISTDLARGLANIVGPAKEGFDQLAADASEAIDKVKQFFSDGAVNRLTFFTDDDSERRASGLGQLYVQARRMRMGEASSSVSTTAWRHHWRSSPPRFRMRIKDGGISSSKGQPMLGRS